MYKRTAGFILAICLIFGLLPGCTRNPVPAETEVPTSAPTQPATEPPTEAPTELPTEPPTEPPTEAPTEPGETVELGESSVVLTAKGEKLEIYCGSVAMENVSWFSDDESIAIFTQGTVVAINKGTTTVYAKFQDQSVSCEVTCDVDPDSALPYIDRDLMYAPRLAPPVVEDMEDTSFFDDAAFIGDSVSYVLQQWHSKTGAFGNATFLVRNSLGLQNTIDGRMKLYYQGNALSPEEAIEQSGVKKIIVMLGLNDLGLFGVEGTVELWDTFLGRILEKCPEVEIYIQSCTSIHADGQYEDFDNELFDAYNVALEAYCEENGYHFINIAPYFKDFKNGMPSKYTSDYYVHMNYDGTAAWERVLKDYAAKQTEGET